jgi:hypothetical protein
VHSNTIDAFEAIQYYCPVEEAEEFDEANGKYHEQACPLAKSFFS